jgi:hypothetical protein
MVSSLNASYTALLHTRALLRMAFLRHDFLTPLSLSLSLSLSSSRLSCRRGCVRPTQTRDDADRALTLRMAMGIAESMLHEPEFVRWMVARPEALRDLVACVDTACVVEDEVTTVSPTVSPTTVSPTVSPTTSPSTVSPTVSPSTVLLALY